MPGYSQPNSLCSRITLSMSSSISPKPMCVQAQLRPDSSSMSRSCSAEMSRLWPESWQML